MYFNVGHHGTDNSNHQEQVPKNNPFEASLKGFPNVPYVPGTKPESCLFPWFSNKDLKRTESCTLCGKSKIIIIF